MPTPMHLGLNTNARLTTDINGAGSFAVEAMGLSPGDRIAVKINTEHYTAIGKIILEVA